MHFHRHLVRTDVDLYEQTIPRYPWRYSPPTRSTNPATDQTGMEAHLPRTTVYQLGFGNRQNPPQFGSYGRTNSDQDDDSHMEVQFRHLESTKPPPSPHGRWHQYPKLPSSCTIPVRTKTPTPPTAQEALFRQPIDNVLNLPGPRLQSWVQRGHAYFNQQLKAAKKRATLNTMDIQSFFHASAQRNNDLQPP